MEVAIFFTDRVLYNITKFFLQIEFCVNTFVLLLLSILGTSSSFEVYTTELMVDRLCIKQLLTTYEF